MFEISESTVDTTTYSDWVTRTGTVPHQVTRLVTPAIRVRPEGSKTDIVLYHVPGQ